MRAGAFKQAATERNSSGGLIYQRAAPSVTQQKLPGVSPPHARLFVVSPDGSAYLASA